MHCPKCGAEAPLTQKFCRVCGFNLDKIPQLVTQQHSESEHLLSDDDAEKLQERKQKIEHWLSMTGIGVGALTAVSLLAGLIFLIAAGNMPFVPGVIILVVLLGGIVAGSLGIYSERLKKTLSDRSSVRSSTPPLETFPVQSISVTERTTSLLEKHEIVKNDKN